jgi:flagellar motor switch protein FliG
MSSIFNFKEYERKYKETVYTSNNFLSQFRAQIENACKRLREFEKPRIELIHEAIHSFVVFETSAEMNNKYDIGNFAKLLERFTSDQELKMIDSFLTGENPFVPSVKNSKFEFVPYEPLECAININQLTEEYLR